MGQNPSALLGQKSPIQSQACDLFDGDTAPCQVVDDFVALLPSDEAVMLQALSAGRTSGSMTVDDKACRIDGIDRRTASGTRHWRSPSGASDRQPAPPVAIPGSLLVRSHRHGPEVTAMSGCADSHAATVAGSLASRSTIRRSSRSK